jgi:hypothetical protein
MPSIVAEQRQGYIRFEVFPERVTFNGFIALALGFFSCHMNAVPS